METPLLNDPSCSVRAVFLIPPIMLSNKNGSTNNDKTVMFLELLHEHEHQLAKLYVAMATTYFVSPTFDYSDVMA